MERQELEGQLRELAAKAAPYDEEAVRAAQKRWNSIAKPLHSLGRLETAVMKMAGMLGTADVRTDKKALVVMCADNGVVAEGVTQTGQEVTAIVAENFLTGNSSAAIMCKKAGIDLYPIDIGMARDTKVPVCGAGAQGAIRYTPRASRNTSPCGAGAQGAIRYTPRASRNTSPCGSGAQGATMYKIAYGTKNMAKEPAMAREEAVRGILTGIRIAQEMKEAGYQILATGEMGIGNTTTSSAVAAVLLDEPVEVMAGRGAGLSGDGLRRKKKVIAQAIALHKPDKNDALDVLSKVGGFDLAGLAGVFLGGAIYRIPVVIDGFISAAAALLAVKMCAGAKEYMLASHVSKEPGMGLILDALGLKAHLTCDMCLGEGTGAVAFLPVLDMAVEVYRKMSTFSDNQIEDYKELEEQ